MKTLILAACALFIMGCSSPGTINDRYANANGLQRVDVRGDEFTHAVYLNGHKAQSRWHVYIDGDGAPWSGRHAIAPDPTAAKPLMLRLMARDAAPAIYLGRPCYHGLANEVPCRPWVWTHGRYSEAVVASMAAALERLLETQRIEELVLIGHSGGGTLTMLLAERIPKTRLLVTIAGNLDIDQWTTRHGYSQLAGSLNPAKRPVLPRSIAQLHFTGEQDRNISPDPVQRLVQNHPGAKHIRVEGAGHERGWEDYFCVLLRQIGGRCIASEALPQTKI